MVDNLEHDHIPSFAAVRAAKEKELGRKLSSEEERVLYNESTAIEVPKDVHKDSPTYKGRNTPSQIEKDANDLCAAACRDINELKTNLLKRGYDKGEIEAAVEKIVRRNREIGIK
ncbi:hypothetical protein [Xanthomonas nasturtii]|uniref:hypothetical protein n=1 Tax=Xanthomonas nasturtii TaxID=1843581 RepID=UPI0012908817|nr:hypothetical protein [Xanthomonas nasturtii]